MFFSSIDDLFGKGVITKGSTEEEFELLEATGDFSDEDDHAEFLDDDRAVLDVLPFNKQKESLADILEKRPPLKALKFDNELHNVTDDGLVRKKVKREIRPEVLLCSYACANELFNEIRYCSRELVVRLRRTPGFSSTTSLFTMIVPNTSTPPC